MFRARRPMTEEPTKPPDRCPQCGSPRVKTTTKPVTASTYWRCEACGEIWNVGRRLPTSRYSR